MTDMTDKERIKLLRKKLRQAKFKLQVLERILQDNTPTFYGFNRNQTTTTNGYKSFRLREQ